MSGLFRFEHSINIDYLKRNISFYNEEEYNRLQKILRSNQCEINYYQADLLDIPNRFKNNQKYQLIILDNILQYYEKIRDISTIYDVNYFIDKNLSTILSEDGLIQTCYGYQISANALKMFLKLPLNKSVENNYFKKILAKESIKTDICTQLINKWDNYSYKFIPGVESENNDYIDNVVITYQKKLTK